MRLVAFLIALVLTPLPSWSESKAAVDAGSESAADAPLRFSVGVGYPDLRARLKLGGPLDGEFKVAFGSGVQAYSGRLYWAAYRLGQLDLTAGLEAGGVKLDGYESLQGGGTYYSGFLGGRWQFNRRWSLGLEAGPAWIQLNSEGVGANGMDLVVTTGVYCAIF